VDTVNRLEKRKVFSPNKKFNISIDMSAIPYKVNLNSVENGKQTIVSDAGTGPIYNGHQRPKIETYWLNNNSFIYTKYHQLAKTENLSRVDMHLYDVGHKKDSIFAVLDSVKSGSGYLNDVFSRDEIGQLLYRSSDRKYYLVDMVRKKLLEYHYYQLGHGFSVANFPKDRIGWELQYNETSLGNQWIGSNIVTEGMIACEYSDLGSNLGYPKGVKVWSSKTRKWTEIEIPWVCCAIGWVDKGKFK